MGGVVETISEIHLSEAMSVLVKPLLGPWTCASGDGVAAEAGVELFYLSGSLQTCALQAQIRHQLGEWPWASLSFSRQPVWSTHSVPAGRRGPRSEQAGSLWKYLSCG